MPTDPSGSAIYHPLTTPPLPHTIPNSSPGALAMSTNYPLTIHMSPESFAELVSALQGKTCDGKPLWPLRTGRCTASDSAANFILHEDEAHRILRVLGTHMLPACRAIARAWPLPLPPAVSGNGVGHGGNGRPDGGLHVIPPASHTTY